MKHASLARFKLLHLLMVLACLFLAGAQTGAHQVAARRPHTLGSLRQQIYGKRSQSKDIGVKTASMCRSQPSNGEAECGRQVHHRGFILGYAGAP